MLIKVMSKILFKIFRLGKINILLFTFFSYHNTVACDCIMYPVASYYDTTSNISIAKVLKISQSESDITIVTVEVIEKLKGKISRKKKIDFMTTTDGCSFHFCLGETYLLFFHSKGDKYEVNECSYSDLMKKSWSNIRKVRNLSHHKHRFGRF